jgi:hypothetical protein
VCRQVEKLKQAAYYMYDDKTMEQVEKYTELLEEVVTVLPVGEDKERKRAPGE